MTMFSTDFSEYTAGVAPPDWSDFWSAGGAVLTINNDGDGISSQYLDIDVTGDGRRAFTWDDVGNVADVDLYTRLIVPFTSLSTGQYVRVYARVSGSWLSENGYYVSIGNGAIQLSKYLDGSPTTLVSKSCLFDWASSKIWCRFQVIGTSLKVKVWDGDAVEPLEWLLTATSSDLTSGAVGVGTYPADDFKVDYFSANTAPPAVDDFPPEGFSPTRFGGFEAPTSTSTGSVVRLLGGQFGDIQALVKGVTVVVGSTHSAQCRLAVYSGGSLATGPEGAVLLADYGLTSGSVTDAAISVFGDQVAIPKNQPLWVAFKISSGFSFRYGSYEGNAGNFQLAKGRFDISAGVSKDINEAFPETLTGITGSYGPTWYAFWAEIEVTSQTPSGSVLPPVLFPPGGPVLSGAQVTITCDTEGATIYYTTDGSTPTTASAVYSGPITITSDTTIKALAVKAGLDDSAVVSGSYTIAAANRAKIFVIT